MEVKLDFLDSILSEKGNNNEQPKTQSSRWKSKINLISSASTTAKTRYDFLYTPEGFHSTKMWFLKNAANMDNFNTLNENQLIAFLRKLTNFKDLQILELFDILDHQDTVSELASLVLLLKAVKGHDYLQHRHGEELFKILADESTQRVDFTRFTGLSCMLGVSEREVLAALQDFQFEASSTLDLEEFMTYSFALLDVLDKQTIANVQRVEEGDLKEPTANPSLLCTVDNKCCIQ